MAPLGGLLCRHEKTMNYAKAITTVESIATETTDTPSSHEVQGEIATAGVVVPSLGMRRERPNRRHPVLAERSEKRTPETGLDENSVEASDNNELCSVALTPTWWTNRTSHERTRLAMGEPDSLELEIRRRLPSFSRGRRNLIYSSIVPYEASACTSATSRIAYS